MQTYLLFLSFETCDKVRPKRKKFSTPACSLISTFAPSNVPIVNAPFICFVNMLVNIQKSRKLATLI